MANKPKSQTPTIILSLPGCDTCKLVKSEMKKKKKWNKIKVVSTATKKGYDMAMKSKTNRYPQCIKMNKNGKPVKCNTLKFLKKFGIKIK